MFAFVKDVFLEKRMDVDQDGVYDDQDNCPSTQAGVKVDTSGCPLDSDDDGVADFIDQCPDTPEGTQVDYDGCPSVKATKSAQVMVIAAEPKIIVLALEDIHFDFDKSNLTIEAQTILRRNIQLLKENPEAQIRIAGYTSAAGTEAINQKLSERRANAVKAYLVNEGIISPDRLSTIGYGETNPAMYEAAPKELYSKAAKANMRVLFEVIVK
jgi:outer membrane protein OmpA-like peptidoglycan-associated protein